jgi:excisionase family DNA binding protein
MTIWRMIQAGEIEAVRAGRRVLLRVSSIEKALGFKP